MYTFSDLKAWIAKTWESKDRRQRLLILAPVAIGILLISATIMVSGSDEMKLPSVKIKRGPVTIKITEIGELQAKDQVTISAINDKQIIWMVPEGQWVEEGDTVLVLESEKYVISSGEAESSLQVAKAELSKTLSNLEAQRTKEEAARKNYESLPELAKKGFVMESEVEQARLSYVELKSITNSYQATVDAARANVQRAERGLAQQERKVRESVLIAPRPGLVVYATVGNEENIKKIEVGMTPFEGMDLMYLPDISSMLVETEISEVDLAKVKVGMPVEIKLDAYAEDKFRGEVVKISDLAKRKLSRITGKATGAKVFQVTVKVLDSDVRLKPGLTATADIIVNEYESVLYAPLEAIFVNELEETVVYVKNKGEIESRKVMLGESNDRVTIIKEGIQEGDEVLLAHPSSVRS